MPAHSSLLPLLPCLFHGLLCFRVPSAQSLDLLEVLFCRGDFEASLYVGYVSLQLKLSEPVTTAPGAIEALSVKIGLVLLVLGGMHLFNLWVFSKIRRNRKLEAAPPPVAPDARIGAASQNVYLQATALGLAAVLVTGFDEAPVLGMGFLSEGYDPLALIAVGLE